VFLPWGECSEAPEQNVFFGVPILPRPSVRVRTWDVFTWAYEVVVRLRAEASGVACIEAVARGKAENC